MDSHSAGLHPCGQMDLKLDKKELFNNDNVKS